MGSNYINDKIDNETIVSTPLMIANNFF